MRRLLRLIVVLACSAAATAEKTETAAACYDAVVVARLVSQKATPLPDVGTEEIVLRWPWVLTFEPQDVLYARVPVPNRSIKVWTTQHTGFHDKIPYFLLFLRHENQEFRAQWIDVHLTRDDKGQFVRPFEDEQDDIDIFPRFWIPPDYLTRLVALRFRTRASWWLREDYDNEGNLIPLSSKPKWTEQRGIRLNDLRSVMEKQAAEPCEDSPYRAG
jgi:hypothetical protein